MKKNKITYHIEKGLEIWQSGLFKKDNGKYFWFDAENQKWDTEIKRFGGSKNFKVVRLDTYLKHLNPDHHEHGDYDKGVLEYFKQEFYKQVLDE